MPVEPIDVEVRLVKAESREDSIDIGCIMVTARDGESVASLRRDEETELLVT